MSASKAKAPAKAEEVVDKLVMVQATRPGQRPSDRKWVNEETPPFEVLTSQLSARWMKVLTPAELKGLKSSDPVDAADPKVVEKLTDQLAEMTTERDAMNEAGRAMAAAHVLDLEAASADLEASQAEVAALQAQVEAGSEPAGGGDPPSSIAEGKTA